MMQFMGFLGLCSILVDLGAQVYEVCQAVHPLPDSSVSLFYVLYTSHLFIPFPIQVPPTCRRAA